MSRDLNTSAGVVTVISDNARVDFSCETIFIMRTRSDFTVFTLKSRVIVNTRIGPLTEGNNFTIEGMRGLKNTLTQGQLD